MNPDAHNLPEGFTESDVCCQRREVLWQGFFRVERLTLTHRLFAGGWTPLLQRELFLRGDAVGVLLFDPALEELVLVEQFRVGAFAAGQRPWLLELVAGMIDAGETPEQVALRECEEEAGCRPRRLIPITRYFSSPGGSDEQIWLYCGLVSAASLSGVYGLDSEHEDIRVVRLSLDDAEQAMQAGRLNNAMTLIALQWLLLNRQRLNEESAETS